jgi:hypothetical protein
MAACGSSCSLDILMQVEDILESRPASRNILFLPVFYVILDPSRTPTPQELSSTGYGNSCSLRITIAADRVRHRNPVDICGAYCGPAYGHRSISSTNTTNFFSVSRPCLR